MSESKLPSKIDHLVGQRLRWRRRELRLTQEQLGEQLGLTFQQVQKYEKGVNRISAGRLYELSTVLDVPVLYFYEGAEDYLALPNGGLSEDSASSWLLALIEDSILAMISFSPGPTSHSPRRSWYVAIHCGLQRGTSRDWCTKPSMRIREQVSCEDCSNRLIANAIRQPKP